MIVGRTPSSEERAPTASPSRFDSWHRAIDGSNTGDNSLSYGRPYGALGPIHLGLSIGKGMIAPRQGKTIATPSGQGVWVKASSLIGRAAVSKTAGCRFKSCLVCKTVSHGVRGDPGTGVQTAAPMETTDGLPWSFTTSS